MKLFQGAVIVAVLAAMFITGPSAFAQNQKAQSIDSIIDQARALAASEPVTNKLVPVFTKTGPAGTFWMLQHDEPPLPFLPFPDLPLYDVDASRDIYIVDDRSVDYPALRAEQTQTQTMSLMTTDGSGPPVPPGGTGDTNYDYTGSGFTPMEFNTNSDLWLEILPAGTNQYNSDPNSVALLLHNPLPDVEYMIETTPSLGSDLVWSLNEPLLIAGEGTNVLAFTMSMAGNSNLFSRALA